MSESAVDLKEVLRQIRFLRSQISGLKADGSPAPLVKGLMKESGQLINELQSLRERISPTEFGPIGITLGRSDSIAKFFAFSFVNQDKRKLGDLLSRPFLGSGVYAVYYHGQSEQAYLPLAGSETPIYVGKADPKNPYAETLEAQGPAIFKRLKEHVRSIGRTTLPINDFQYRYAAIQTGMQAAVEDFMIRLFRPIWNKEIKICYGIGKHGDAAQTRANKRSPWDTMHPGRQWAANTAEDQVERSEIETRISSHFSAHSVIADKDALYKHLSLG
jgi:hypothetical protein